MCQELTYCEIAQTSTEYERKAPTQLEASVRCFHLRPQAASSTEIHRVKAWEISQTQIRRDSWDDAEESDVFVMWLLLALDPEREGEPERTTPAKQVAMTGLNNNQTR